jgi:Holliday junction resolvase RusA-like endonuclease
LLADEKTFKRTPKKDLDNLQKSVLDACNGVLYHDDSQIIKVRASKFWSDKNKITMMISTVEVQNPETKEGE